MQIEKGVNLPDAAIVMAKKIERCSGMEIVFRRYTYSEKKNPNFNSTRPGVKIKPDKRQADVMLQSFITRPGDSIHELLHLDRYLVEGIPQIVPRLNGVLGNWPNSAYLENTLEHLAIVPREWELTGDDGFWHCDSSGAMNNFMRKPDQFGLLSLCAVFVLAILPGSKAQDLCNEFLAERKLEKQTADLLNLVATTPEKRDRARGALKILRFPEEPWQFQWFDPERREFFVSKLDGSPL